MTLAEIEAMFGIGSDMTGQVRRVPVIVRPNGRRYSPIQGAVFYELEDLGNTPAVTSLITQRAMLMREEVSGMVLPPVASYSVQPEAR